MTDRPRPPADELDWQPVLAWLPVFNEPSFDAGRWMPAKQAPSGVVTCGYAVLSEDAGAFLHCLYDSEVVAPFDWTTWSGEGRGRILVEQPEAITDASLEECRMLLTAHARADRFSEGHLLGVLNDGTVTRILTRVRTLLGAEGGMAGS